MLPIACREALAATCPQQTPIAFHAWCGKPQTPLWSRAHARLYRTCSCSVDKISPRSETPAAQYSRPLVHIKSHPLSTGGVENSRATWIKKRHVLKPLQCGARRHLSTPNPHRFPRHVWKTARHSIAGRFVHHQLYDRPSWPLTSLKPIPPLCRLSWPQPRQPPDRFTCTPAAAS